MRISERARAWLERRVGGRARARVIAVLAAVLALQTADMSAVGAMAKLLEREFRVSDASIGLLVSVSSGVAAAGTIFFGWLADRATRTRVLALAIVAWGAISALSGASTGYVFLLVTRVGLGLATAAVLPIVASLVGDFFPPRERARIYGYVLSGELVGTGVGFALSGELASLWWRLGFWSLAVPAPFLAWAVARLHEPARGGADRLEAGQERTGHEGRRGGAEEDEGDAPERRAVRKQVLSAGVRPREDKIPDEDPRDASLWWAFRYVLSIPTNLVLIIGSALTYYFFAGVRVFGVKYLSWSFGIGHAATIWVILALGAGALAGVWIGGHVADALVARGHLRGRIWVAVAGIFATTAFFLLALVVQVAWLEAILLFFALAALGAVSPPLDAARLDIMHPSLWGRAESVRAVLRNAGESGAPFVFGWLASAGFGGGMEGLRLAFLSMLGPLFVGGLVGAIALRTYLRDVATADAYAERTTGGRDGASRRESAPRVGGHGAPRDRPVEPATHR